METNYKKILKNIKLLAFDVDGVLSTTTVVINEPFDILRTANVKDGFAIQLAVKKGYRIVIITGGKCESVRKRFELLGVKDIFLGAEEKLPIFENFLKTHSIKWEEVLYMGDDIPDYEIMKKVGLPACPCDAAEEIKAISKYISDKKGGEGCVRDIIEQLLKLNGHWMQPGEMTW